MHEHMNEDYLTMTHGQRFYAEQLEYLQQKNVDGLIENQYAPDAELLGFDFQVKGHEALRKHFHTYLEMLGKITVLSTDKFTETEDSIMFEATVETQRGTFRVYDAFVLENGKAIHHFTGVF